MYFLNYHHTVSNLSRLIKTTSGVDTTPSTLSKDYRDFVGTTREVAVDNHFKISFEDDTLGMFIRNEGIFNGVFSKIFCTTTENRDSFKQRIEESLIHIANVDSRLSWLVDTLMTDVVLFQSDRYGGGSASHLPGVICISPNDDWEVSDFAECIVHEVTHLNLFLCDMVNGIFRVSNLELGREDAKVVSAVRIGELRPLDKALHSAVVAVPLLYMQEINNQTTLSDLFTDSLKVCADGLIEKKKYFTDYGFELVKQLRDFSINQNFDNLRGEIGNKKFARYLGT